MEAYKILSRMEEETLRSMMRLRLDAPIPTPLLMKLKQYKELLNRVDGRLNADTMAMILIDGGFMDAAVEDLPVPEPEAPPAESPEPTPSDADPDTFEPEPEIEPEEEPEPVEPPRNFLKNGTKVTVIVDGEMVTGLIEAHQVVEEDVFYDVKIDNEDNDIVNMHEDDLTVEE